MCTKMLVLIKTTYQNALYMGEMFSKMCMLGKMTYKHVYIKRNSH